MLGEELSRALSDISDDKIAEAAAITAGAKRRVWPRFVAAAAALVILLGTAALLWPGTEAPGEYLPILAIRAYAVDGSVATLGTAGDNTQLRTDASELFPDKEVFILDVSLTDAKGNRLDLADCTFYCSHWGEKLQPGESDEGLAIMLVDEADFYGYRIVGWCDEYDYLDVTIRGANGWILHQKELHITYDGQYQANVIYSYHYEPNLTTEQLIAKLFDSGYYSWRTMYASSPTAAYSSLVNLVGGYAELEQRPDAASLLLERWVQEMGKSEYRFVSVQGSGRVGLLLAQTPYWRNLTEEELALIESMGYSRGCPEPEENDYFPGHRIFRYTVKMGPQEARDYVLEITYNDQKIRSGEDQVKDEHFNIQLDFWMEFVQTETHAYSGWSIVGWFDEQTEITLSVYDGEELVRQEVLLITPSEDRYDEYQIEILEKTP